MIFHYPVKFKNFTMNSEKYVFHWEKWNLKHIGNSAQTTEFLVLENPQYLYQLSDVLSKQTREMKTLQVQVYIQQ